VKACFETPEVIITGLQDGLK